MDTCICIDEVVYKPKHCRARPWLLVPFHFHWVRYVRTVCTKPSLAKNSRARSLPRSKKTRAMRSHLSGNHPAVSGDDQCLSRKHAQLKSNTLATAVEAGAAGQAQTCIRHGNAFLRISRTEPKPLPCNVNRDKPHLAFCRQDESHCQKLVVLQHVNDLYISLVLSIWCPRDPWLFFRSNSRARPFLNLLVGHRMHRVKPLWQCLEAAQQPARSVCLYPTTRRQATFCRRTKIPSHLTPEDSVHVPLPSFYYSATTLQIYPRCDKTSRPAHAYGHISKTPCTCRHLPT